MATATATRTRKTARKPARRGASPAKVEAARERDAALTERADKALEAADLGARVVSAITAGADISRYSVRNQALLLDQAEERGMTLTQVATFRQWKDMGRSVRKGEKALTIVRPVGREDKAEQGAEQGAEPTAEQPRTGATVAEDAPVKFRGMSVFDISQTDGIDGAEDATETDGDADGGQADRVAVLLDSIRTTADRTGYTVATGPAAAVDLAGKVLTLPAKTTPENLAALVGAVAEIVKAQKTERAARKAKAAPADDVETITVF